MKSKLSANTRNLYLSRFLFFYILVLLPLIYSFIKSGFGYTFDKDELSHVQIVYLLSNGFKPFTSFFSIYSPLFHYFLAPLFKITGFTLESISMARVFMIILLVVRLIFSLILIKKVFNARVALLFLPLFLIDPFTVFASMQIRPDNFAITIYVVGLFLFSLGLLKSSKKYLVISAIALSISFLASIKILPSIFVILVIYSIYSFVKNRLRSLFPFYIGILFPIVLFSLFFLIQGSFTQMVQQLFIDAKATNDAILHPSRLGNFYLSQNIYIYGLVDRPITWMYVWMLPILAFLGIYHVLLEALSEKRINKTLFLKIILSISLLLHWLSLFMVKSVFIQYYLPISWLFALFAATFVDQILAIAKDFNKFYQMAMIGLIIFISLEYFSIKGNLFRSTILSSEIKKHLTRRWSQIPKNSYVFPNFLFRPLAYPLPYGYYMGDIPNYILDRLPKVSESLEGNQVNYLLIDSNAILNLPIDARVYIEQNYKRVEGDNELWIRKS